MEVPQAITLPLALVLDGRLSAPARLALAVLAGYGELRGEATLAEHLGCSVRQARRYLAELRQHDLLAVERPRIGQSATYRIKPDKSVLCIGQICPMENASTGGQSLVSSVSNPIGQICPMVNKVKPRDISKGETEGGVGGTSPWDTSVPWRAVKAAVVEVVYRGARLTPSETVHVDQAVTELVTAGATPAEVRLRFERMRRAWSDRYTITARALARHWNSYAQEGTRSSGYAVAYRSAADRAAAGPDEY